MKKTSKILALFLAIATLISIMSVGLLQSSAASTLRTSSNGIEFIKKFEGFYPNPYWDYSQWSIGYGSYAGSRDQNKKPNITVTVAQATEMLKNELVSHENVLNKFANTYNKTFSQNQFDALVSFSYNVGSSYWTNLPNFTLGRLIRDGNYTDKQIRDAFLLFVKAGGKTLQGLVDRRNAEADLFLKGSVINTSYTSIIALPGKTSGSSVNMRTAPVNGSVITCMSSSGTAVTVDGYLAGSDGYVWYHVKYGSSAGFIRSDLIAASSASASAKTSASSVNMRTSPVSGSVITCISAKGAALTIAGFAAGSDNYVWYKVNYKSGSANQTGYIRCDLVSL